MGEGKRALIYGNGGGRREEGDAFRAIPPSSQACAKSFADSSLSPFLPLR